MEYKIKRKTNPNIAKYLRDDVNLAYKFSDKVVKEFKDLVKCIVLFGSTARGDAKLGANDIDILIIINDLSIELSSEVSQTYRVIIEKLVMETSNRLHVVTLKLTNFWEYARVGDPIAINMLRDGVSLYDPGFFEPLQMLLWNGRIRPSTESIWTYFARAPATIQNSKWHILQATLDLYWAVIDASHAALMKLNQIPPSPSHVADMIDEKLVKPGMIDRKYSKLMRKFYALSKMIVHREIKDISGQEYDNYLKEAEDYVEYMRLFVSKKK